MDISVRMEKKEEKKSRPAGEQFIGGTQEHKEGIHRSDVHLNNEIQ
jgi:hypothetical protein